MSSHFSLDTNNGPKEIFKSRIDNKILNKLKKGAAFTHLAPYKKFKTEVGKTINNNRNGETITKVVIKADEDHFLSCLLSLIDVNIGKAI